MEKDEASVDAGFDGDEEGGSVASDESDKTVIIVE